MPRERERISKWLHKNTQQQQGMRGGKKKKLNFIHEYVLWCRYLNTPHPTQQNTTKTNQQQYTERHIKKMKNFEHCVSTKLPRHQATTKKSEEKSMQQSHTTHNRERVSVWERRAASATAAEQALSRRKALSSSYHVLHPSSTCVHDRVRVKPRLNRWRSLTFSCCCFTAAQSPEHSLHVCLFAHCVNWFPSLALFNRFHRPLNMMEWSDDDNEIRIFSRISQSDEASSSGSQ